MRALSDIDMGGSRSVVRIAVVAFVLLSAPAVATALDGRLDARGTRTEGLAAGSDFTTSILRFDASVEQQIRLARHLVLRAAHRDLREDSESRSSLLTSEYSTRTLLPTLALNYRANAVRAGLSADGYRRSYDGGAFGERLDERLDLALYGQYNFDRGTAMLRAHDTTSDRREADGGWIENADRGVRGSLRLDTAVGEFLYTGSRTRDEALTVDLRRDRTAHGLRYQGAAVRMDGRLRASVEARADRFEESVTTGGDDAALRLVPIFTGYLLDATPEDIDPLEPSPAALPGLSDFDRDTPTSLDIGDDTDPVVEYGGDYRNIVLDFGDPLTVTDGAVYVDRIVRFPEFLEWRLYTSDDPQGIDWTEVSPALFTAVWREWNDGRQGWELTLADPVRARRFKLVDVKSGPTEPSILVNEVELRDAALTGDDVVESVTNRRRLVGSLSYDATSRLTLGYRANLTSRTFDDSDRDLTGRIHTFDARMRLDGWTLAALHSLNTLESPSRLNTDTRTTALSATSDVSRPLWVRLSWHHDDDRSFHRSRITDDGAVDLSWSIAPGLTLLQKVGRGMLDDGVTGLESSSWFSVTTMRSRPRRSMVLDLRRSSRWVSRDAGEGFSSFDDLDGTLRWSLFPLLTYSGQVRYESRDDEEWLWRHILSWNPLTTGSMDIRFSVNHYSDTRTDTRQRGGGVDVTWRARPSLRLEGRVDVQDHERNGVTSTPLNTRWRATWTF